MSRIESGGAGAGAGGGAKIRICSVRGGWALLERGDTGLGGSPQGFHRGIASSGTSGLAVLIRALPGGGPSQTIRPKIMGSDYFRHMRCGISAGSGLQPSGAGSARRPPAIGLYLQTNKIWAIGQCFFRSAGRFAVQEKCWSPLGLPLAATATWRPGDGTQPPQSHVMRRVGLGTNHGRSQTNIQVDLDATLFPLLLRLLPPQIHTNCQVYRVCLFKSPYPFLELISVSD